MKINFTLNYKEIEIEINPLMRTLDLLRKEFGLFATKEGCGDGECGACAIILDDKIVNSCMVPVANIHGKEIVTIEGLEKTERYSILKKSFEDAGAVQCGFCIPGMMMAAEALFRRHKTPTLEQIKEGISGNLCRCTGYNMIIEAIELAAERGKEIW
ncbi:(2Fe-2S)-binding protein [Ilyobacter polytropus]|uniref:(2Fe-2S)-binding domain protein n=1 Tax=Ilyobacter polytropus (strain ATCC 51220 / DSM 2926 / LMG 16218 / CuHBu1) TaxID=572544 RepID=E3H725_ILYPC|nr:(2Fe-2S)-binding protein [Ilyobacter polytropus]ADO81921.1 (2Fe-2S)-binding domain protein [Ilyobacter polytropus DSM 2926]